MCAYVCIPFEVNVDFSSLFATNYFFYFELFVSAFTAFRVYVGQSFLNVSWFWRLALSQQCSTVTVVQKKKKNASSLYSWLRLGREAGSHGYRQTAETGHSSCLGYQHGSRQSFLLISRRVSKLFWWCCVLCTVSQTSWVITLRSHNDKGDLCDWGGQHRRAKALSGSTTRGASTQRGVTARQPVRVKWRSSDWGRNNCTGCCFLFSLTLCCCGSPRCPARRDVTQLGVFSFC